MNLHIGGNWHLKSDPLNLTLVEKKISTQKNSLGKQVETERGNYSTLEQVLHSVLGKGIMKSDAVTLAELNKDVEQLGRLIGAFCSKNEKKFKELWKENEALKLEVKYLTNKISKNEEGEAEE